MAKNKIQYFNDLVTIQPTLYRIKDECKFCLHLKHSLALKIFFGLSKKSTQFESYASEKSFS